MRTLLLALTGFLLTLGHGAALADTRIVGGNFSGTTGDFIGLRPFDPALGTLDSVNVTIDGTITVSGFAPANMVFTGQFLVPRPYSFQATVDQTFFGVGKYFTFDDAARFTLPGAASGLPGGFTLATGFSYSFNFTETTDLFGFTFASVSSTLGSVQPPVIGVVGTRADFYPTLASIDEVDLVQSWSGIGVDGPVPIVGPVLTEGTLLVQYNYTPAVAAIPEPETYALMLAGLGLLGFAVRKKPMR